jgi:hypothetical protein
METPKDWLAEKQSIRGLPENITSGTKCDKRHWKEA